MDSSSPSSNNPPPSQDLGGELSHITQELYKRNFELADKNKTLAILRKIDDIILSTVTDISQVTKQVTDVVVAEAEFKAVTILVLDKENRELIRIAESYCEPMDAILVKSSKHLFIEKLSLSKSNKLIVDAINERQEKISNNLTDFSSTLLSEEELKNISSVAGISSTLIYPLVARGESLGVITICLGENEETLFGYQKDLIIRLVNIIGIAVDNSLLYQNIQEANERLKSLDKLKDEFVSLASHELRTPMTVVKQYLWMVIAGREGPLTDKQKTFLDRAYQSTEELLVLVNDMLDVSRIEANKITLDLKPVSMTDTVTQLVSELSPRSQELGVPINIASHDDIPQVFADSGKLKEVLTNLLGNSLKYTPRGGNITVSFTRKDGMVELDIKDTGVGIKPEDLPKLFQKFGRLEQGKELTKERLESTGLGLYIVKSIVELHGGKIWVSSEGENMGSTFSFTLLEDTEENRKKIPESAKTNPS